MYSIDYSPDAPSSLRILKEMPVNVFNLVQLLLFSPIRWVSVAASLDKMQCFCHK